MTVSFEVSTRVARNAFVGPQNKHTNEMSCCLETNSGRPSVGTVLTVKSDTSSLMLFPPQST